MECPVCGSAIQKVTGKRTGHYRGERVEVESEFLRCRDCGETLFTPAQAKAHNRSVRNEIREKYGLLPPDKIVEIRNRLKLSQVDLEHLLGTGEKVVVRWENGKVIQTRGHDSLLRLLDRDPSIMEKLRQIQEVRDIEQKRYEEQTGKKPKQMTAQAVGA